MYKDVKYVGFVRKCVVETKSGIFGGGNEHSECNL